MLKTTPLIIGKPMMEINSTTSRTRYSRRLLQGRRNEHHEERCGDPHG
ncbi:MAG: hypothetical protein WA946_11535 [Nitrospirota bacterium]